MPVEERTLGLGEALDRVRDEVIDDESENTG